MFRLQPDRVYLMGDRAVFPAASGMFRDCEPTCTYEVCRDDVNTAATSIGRARDQPFGAYPSFSRSSSLPHPPLPIKARQQQRVQKSIMLVTLSLPDLDKPSTPKALVYNVITQTQVTMDPTCCNPTAIASTIYWQ